MATQTSTMRGAGLGARRPGGVLAGALPRRAVLLCLVAAAVLGALAGARPDPRILVDPELTRLLRAMALLKGAMVAAALALLHWRLGWQVSPAPGALYLGAVVGMAVASVWIWQPTSLAAAALVFHLGMAAGLAGAWLDRGGKARAPS